MGIIKNNNGITPFVGLIILLIVSGGIGVTALGVYELTQRPDITYNVTESPFSFFGNQIDWIWIILIGVGIVFLLIWGFARTRKAKPEVRPYYPPYRRE